MADLNPITVACPYCGQPASKTVGAKVRPEKREVADRTVWVCEPCDANVWCYEGTDRPNGIMANKELRFSRIEFNKIATWAAFKAGIPRAKNRPWIANELGISPENFRLNNLNIEQVRSGFDTMLAYLNGSKGATNG